MDARALITVEVRAADQATADHLCEEIAGALEGVDAGTEAAWQFSVRAERGGELAFVAGHGYLVGEGG